MYDCENIYKKIGKKIAFHRRLKQLSQEELAKKVGISISYLSKIEAPNCNKSFSLVIACQIANVLEIDIEKLFRD